MHNKRQSTKINLSATVVAKYHSYTNFRKLLRRFWRKIFAKKIQQNNSCSALVILHLFYPESWREIEQYLMNLECYSWDLCVTYPIEHEADFDFAAIRRLKPDARLMPMANRGCDVAPFIMAIKTVNLDQYDVIFKIHSKGIQRSWTYIYRQLFLGRDWFLNLYEGILGARTVHQTIDKLYNNDKVGLVCADNLFVKDPLHKQHLVMKGFAQLGLEKDLEYRFVAGSCFAAKPEPFKAVQHLAVTWGDFEPIPKSRGLSLTQILERYLSVVITNYDYSASTNKVCRLRRLMKVPVEKILNKFSSERLFQTPYRFDDEFFLYLLDNRLIKYKIRQIEVGRLCDAYFNIFSIKECLPYRYLTGEKEAYEQYCRLHAENGWPLMTEARFQALIASLEQNGYDESQIIIVNKNNSFIDGKHRACYLAWKYGLDYKINVMEIRFLS